LWLRAGDGAMDGATWTSPGADAPGSGSGSGSDDQRRLAELLLEAKQYGFAAKQLAYLGHGSEMEVRRGRKALGAVPVCKLVDNGAAEFEGYTPYYYSTYERPFGRMKDEGGRMKENPSDSSFILPPSSFVEDETRPPTLGRERIMILGG